MDKTPTIEVDLLVTPYAAAPQQIAILLRDSKTHEPLGNITKCVPDYNGHPNDILVKTYSENTGWVKNFLLSHPGYFIPTGVQLPVSQYASLEVWQITPKFRKLFLSPKDKTNE